LRNLNQGGFLEGADVAGTNFFSDLNNAWLAGTVVTPTLTQTNPSIQWNPSVGNQNNLPGQWGTLESINFVIDDLTDTGPFNLYLDNLQNGTTVFQTFEAAPANTTDYGFRAPGFSGTTSGNILPAPNQATVANRAADGGTKSLRVEFQWNGVTASKWLRLTTPAFFLQAIRMLTWMSPSRSGSSCNLSAHRLRPLRLHRRCPSTCSMGSPC